MSEEDIYRGEACWDLIRVLIILPEFHEVSSFQSTWKISLLISVLIWKVFNYATRVIRVSNQSNLNKKRSKFSFFQWKLKVFLSVRCCIILLLPCIVTPSHPQPLPWASGRLNANKINWVGNNIFSFPFKSRKQPLRGIYLAEWKDEMENNYRKSVANNH